MIGTWGIVTKEMKVRMKEWPREEYWTEYYMWVEIEAKQFTCQKKKKPRKINLVIKCSSFSSFTRRSKGDMKEHRADRIHKVDSAS